MIKESIIILQEYYILIAVIQIEKSELSNFFKGKTQQWAYNFFFSKKIKF